MLTITFDIQKSETDSLSSEYHMFLVNHVRLKRKQKQKSEIYDDFFHLSIILLCINRKQKPAMHVLDFEIIYRNMNNKISIFLHNIANFS